MGAHRVGTVDVYWDDAGGETESRIDAELQRLVCRLVEMGAERVVLFGSRARRTSRRDSDVDLLVVMPNPPPGPFPRRLASLYEALEPNLALDLLAYTPEELNGLAAERGFVREALQEGEVLHGQ